MAVSPGMLTQMWTAQSAETDPRNLSSESPECRVVVKRPGGSLFHSAVRLSLLAPLLPLSLQWIYSERQIGGAISHL